MEVDEKHIAAIVLAAGNGVRMGKGLSKVLLPLGAETVLERAVNAFLAVPRLNELVIVCRAEDRATMETLPYHNPRGIKLSFVNGGRVRQESVFCGLQLLVDNAQEKSGWYVAIHDAARCFVHPETINRAIEAAFTREAVTVAVPLIDSIKRVAADGRVEESISRDQIWCVQTPQVFRLELIYQAHLRSRVPSGAPGASDDASLVEALRPVYVCQGERGNFKVTTPEDYEIARTVAAME